MPWRHEAATDGISVHREPREARCGGRSGALLAISRSDYSMPPFGLLRQIRVEPTATVRELSSKGLESKVKSDWDVEYEAWRQRDLSDRELVYLWADGLYVKAG